MNWGPQKVYMYVGTGHLMSDSNLPLEVISRQAEIIVCYRTPHTGVWVQHLSPGPTTKANLRAHKTALEMAVGNAKVIYNNSREQDPSDRYNNAEPLRVRIADDKQWAFLIGLVVCGLAERIQIS